ncbi:hypothetical protein HPP92_019912 [Vanilla planifolia]|uniref:FAE domain-containing protein n=1 Tax=Vanilla planifolia TaxID=51239 RepID=A0A835Q6N0_VANPL|nr:hypothetical protein HPP92_019912 [Vanilla planifolia]
MEEPRHHCFAPCVNLKYVKLGYHYLVSHAMYLLLIPVLAAAASCFSVHTTNDLLHLWDALRYNLISVVLCSALLVFISTVYFTTRPRPVFLVDYACFKPADKQRCTREGYLERASLTGAFTDDALAFQERVIERSGLGQATYLPNSIARIPANTCMAEARKEAEQVMFGAIDELLEKTRVRPKEIGILIVNCSLFNPTPCLSSMVVHHYKLRGNILSYNLGGMGCSAGLISVDLAKHLLQVHPNTYCMVVSTENITLNWYLGNNMAMLVSNRLFRVGGAALLFSNRRSDRVRSKYRLVHTVRTHKGADDRFYRCVFQEDDESPSHRLGVSLSKDLMSVAGEALKTNITTLGPLVLPFSE